MTIALIGDNNADVVAHRGINRSLELLQAENPAVGWRWCHSSSLGSDPADQLAGFSGMWVVPASPYANEAGVLRAIRHARESGMPFLGTCGGFQHAVIEFARNVMGLAAEHAETAPDAAVQVITPLSCSMVEQTGAVRLVAGTRVAQLYGAASGREGYHCNYGLNHEFLARLQEHGLVVAARDDAGEVRALELPSHPFYVLTLFQPERRALRGEVHPLVRAFVLRSESTSEIER